jgi:hypothetical protein
MTEDIIQQLFTTTGPIGLLAGLLWWFMKNHLSLNRKAQEKQNTSMEQCHVALLQISKENEQISEQNRLIHRNQQEILTLISLLIDRLPRQFPEPRLLHSPKAAYGAE